MVGDKVCMCFPVASRDAKTGLCCETLPVISARCKLVFEISNHLFHNSACGLHIDTVHTVRYRGEGNASSHPRISGACRNNNFPVAAAVPNPYTMGNKCTGGGRAEEGLLLQSCCNIPDGTPEVDLHAARIWVYPSNVPVREYQKSIVSRALFSNTLVCLPTGMGKTLIAAVVMANFHRWYPDGQVIFMGPTKPLVNQQIRACHDVMGLLPERTAELQGNVKKEEREVLWKKRHIFYCTPQSLVNDIKSGACLPKRTVCVVVDESHKATGKYAYVEAINAIAAATPRFRVLALSATPGSDAKSVQQVLTNLRVSIIECWGEDDPEIAQHTHLRQQEVIKCPIGKGLSDLRTGLFAVMKPTLQNLISSHVIHAMSPENVHPYVCIMARDKLLTRGGSRDPNIRPDDFGRLLDDLTLLTKLANIKDNLGTHGAADLCSKLDGWEKEMRSGSCKSRSLGAMLRTDEFQSLLKCAKRLAGCSNTTSDGGKGGSSISHPKLTKLRDVLREHFQRLAAGTKSTRAIVFSQFRSSVDEIVSFLEGEELLSVCRFVGQSSSSNSSDSTREEAAIAAINKAIGKPLKAAAAAVATTASFTRGQSQKEQQAVLAAFRNGEYNCLVATCIAEEGLDVGEVDLIVSYDCLSSPVRMVQRMGRTGRKRPGRVVMLVTERIEESKLQSSASKSKRIVNLLKNQGKFVLYPELNSRMIPPEIDPEMVQEDIVIPKYRASQIGGVCSSSRVSKVGDGRDLGAGQQHGGVNSSNSTSWRLTTSQLKKLKECYSAETTYEANPLSGWLDSRCRFRTMRFPHSHQTLALLDVRCFVENQEWETLYNEARMVAMLDLWYVNNGVGGCNYEAAPPPPLIHVQSDDKFSRSNALGGQEEEEDVYGHSSRVSKQKPKAPPLQDHIDERDDQCCIPNSPTTINCNNENIVVKMHGGSMEGVLRTVSNADDIYLKGNTGAVLNGKPPPHQTLPNCNSISSGAGTLLGLGNGKESGDIGGVVAAKSKSIGEVWLLSQREGDEKKKSFGNNEEQQRYGIAEESTWKIERSKKTASDASGCKGISSSIEDDDHHHCPSGEEHSFHQHCTAENENVTTIATTSHDLLQQAPSLPFPLFDSVYKKDVNDNAGCVPREARRSDFPAIGLLDLPIPPMAQPHSHGSSSNSYQQHGTPFNDDNSLDFWQASTSTCGGRSTENEQHCLADPVVMEQHKEEGLLQVAVNALNNDDDDDDVTGTEDNGEDGEGSTPSAKADGLSWPPLQCEEREGEDMLFPSQSTAIDACDVRCMEEEDNEADCKPLKVMNRPANVEDCNGMLTSALCGVCGGNESLDDDPIVLCEGTGCDVAVHAGCFGILNIPAGEWHCDTCKLSLSRDDRGKSSSSSPCDVVVFCSLCGNSRGAMKQTKGQAWVHLVCAVWTPEIGLEYDEPSVIPRSPSFIDPKRAFYRCVECAGLGGGVLCSTNQCTVAVHPFCASKAGYKLCFPSSDDSDEDQHGPFFLHCRGHSKCSPLFPCSPSDESSENAKKKLIQLMAMDAVNEVQREAEAAGAGGRKKCEFQWQAPNLGTITQLTEKRMGIQLRDQHSRDIICHELCKLKSSKPDCPARIDSTTPPPPRRAKKRTRVISDDSPPLFPANATTTKTSSPFGPEKICIEDDVSCSEDRAVPRSILTPVGNVVQNISKPSKECIYNSIGVTSSSGVYTHNVVQEEHRSKILKRKPRQQQQQYSVGERKQECKEVQVRHCLNKKHILLPEEKRMIGEYLLDMEAEVTSGGSSDEDDMSSNTGTQHITASQDSFINDESIGHSQTQSPVSEFEFESEHAGAEVDHRTKHRKTSYKTSGFSPAFYRQVNALNQNGMTPSPILDNMKRSRFIGAILQYAKEGGDAVQIEQSCMSSPAESNFSETQSSPTPSHEGPDVPPPHHTLSSCSVMRSSTSTHHHKRRTFYSDETTTTSNSSATTTLVYHAKNKGGAELTDDQVRRIKENKLEALQRRQHIEDMRREKQKQHRRPPLEHCQKKEEENHQQEHKNTTDQQRQHRTVNRERVHGVSLGNEDENGKLFEEKIEVVRSEAEDQSMSSNMCEEKRVAVAVAVTVAVTAKVGTETETETKTKNAFNTRRQESVNCGKPVVSGSNELSVVPSSRKPQPRMEDQEYHHPPLAIATTTSETEAAASRADPISTSPTATEQHHDLLIVLQSSNLSPIAASVAAKFGFFDWNTKKKKKISLVLSSSIEKEAHGLKLRVACLHQRRYQKLDRRRTVIVLVVDNANVKVAAGKSLSSQIEWLKCLLGRGIVLIQCSDALNAANEIERIRVEEERQMRGLSFQVVMENVEKTPDGHYLSLTIQDSRKLPVLPLSSAGRLCLQHALRQKPLTEALNFSARDVRASVPGMSAQQAGIITKHLRRALKARRECTNYSSIH